MVVTISRDTFTANIRPKTVSLGFHGHSFAVFLMFFEANGKLFVHCIPFRAAQQSKEIGWILTNDVVSVKATRNQPLSKWWIRIGFLSAALVLIGIGTAVFPTDTVAAALLFDRQPHSIFPYPFHSRPMRQA